MHNSGTSLLGNLMHAAGVPMGPKLLLREKIPEERRPRYDYFEDHDVVQLQDQTLLDLQRHWSSYRGSFRLPGQDHPARQRFRAELMTLVLQRFAVDPLWLVKDPRSAVLAEDWLTVLRDLEISCTLVLVHRDPTSNIRSFSSKGQVPLLWAEALWQRTYANALGAASELADQQVLVTDFDQLMHAPHQEVQRLCEALDWSVPETVLERLQGNVDPSLPTQTSAATSTGVPKTLTLHPATTHLQQRLLDLQLDASGLPELLASAMAESMADVAAPLQLNGELCEGQTLLPKVSVALVTAELQGWGPGGGIGSAVRELALTLAEAGHAVTVLLVQSNEPQSGIPLAGVSVTHLNSAGLSRLQLVRRIATALQTLTVDVVHLHDWLGYGSGLRQALGADGPKIVVGLHGPSAWTRSGNPWPRSNEGGLLASEAELFDEGLVRALERDALDQADWLVSPSSALATWVQEQLLPGQPRERLLVNRNCPLPERLRAMARPDPTLPLSPCDLVYFGRLEQRKGLTLFLDTLLRLNPRPKRVLFLGNDCVVGRSRDGSPEWGSERIRRQLQGSGIEATLEHGLQRDEALQLLMNLRAPVVIPSLIENSPCVVEELLNSGLPMVVSAVGGTAELVRPQDRHWLSAPEPEALAHHLQKLLAISASDRKAYRLHAAIENWRIPLSWQAFHERLPRAARPGDSTSSEPDGHDDLLAQGDPWPLWRRALRKSRHLAGRGRRQLQAWLKR